MTVSADIFQRMLEFAMELSQYFDSFGILMGNRIILHGRLLLDNKYDVHHKQKVPVFIEIDAPAPFAMPVVYCPAKWLKHDPEWHIYKNGELCWELGQNWSGKMQYLQNQNNIPLNAITKFASTWVANSVITLLYRHWYVAFIRNDIIQWPVEWESWAHGKEGVRQYERLKRTTYQ